MKHPVVCFDLDGTLLDTLEDLAAAANTTLATHGYAQHPVAAYRQFVGNGVETLIRRALPPGEVDHCTSAQFAAIMDTMRTAYAAHAAEHTRPYPGVPELLAALRTYGAITAVLTNKPHPAALNVLRHYFPEHTFAAIHGATAGVPLKPQPDVALRLAAELGYAPSEILYLGDSDVDMQFARAAGMRPIGAGWGFRGADELRAAGALIVCTTPDELLPLLPVMDESRHRAPCDLSGTAESTNTSH